MTDFSSRLSGFHQLTRVQRLWVARELLELHGGDPGDLDSVFDAPDLELFDRFVENLIGALSLPLGIATNFLIDGREVLVPMAVEEASVVAAASHGARMCRASGGFTTEQVQDEMIGQVQLEDVDDVEAAVQRISAALPELQARSSALKPGLHALGGGLRSIACRVHTVEASDDPPWLVVHLHVGCVDAMGANAVTTLCEELAPRLEELSGGRAALRILSNFADRRRTVARCRVLPQALATAEVSGDVVAARIARATAFAAVDVHRATTHNKGIMNGVDAVVVATGNDWRAVEAGAHAWAAREGRYGPLSSWTVAPDGALLGELEMPVQVGVVGGVTEAHPSARMARSLVGAETAAKLASAALAAGLATHLASLRALVTEGVMRGHLALHQRKEGYEPWFPDSH